MHLHTHYYYGPMLWLTRVSVHAYIPSPHHPRRTQFSDTHAQAQGTRMYTHTHAHAGPTIVLPLPHPFVAHCDDVHARTHSTSAWPCVFRTLLLQVDAVAAKLNVMLPSIQYDAASFHTDKQQQQQQGVNNPADATTSA